MTFGGSAEDGPGPAGSGTGTVGPMPLQHDYPLAPEALFAVVTDPAYLGARGARFGGVGTPEVERQGYLVVVRTQRQLPPDKIPGPARGMVGNGIIEQEDTWTLPDDDNGSVTATWRAHLGSAPAALGGEHRITVIDDGSRYAITVDVKVHIPLLGRKLEDQVSGYLQLLIGKELDFLGDWITESGD